MRTLQLILATDFIHTHGFYLYDDSTIYIPNSIMCQERRHHAVMGYDAKDLQYYFNLPMPDIPNLHQIPGNTGRTGEWHFNFTSPPGQATAKQRCLNWATREDSKAMIDLSTLLVKHCPCTLQQLQFDWRFWFGYLWGLTTSQNCATVLFSGSQHTLECCYDDDGALIVGPREGGSYKRYNPLFFNQDYYQDDLLPYYDCCEESSLCRLYNYYRPFDDCSQYRPLFPCE